MKIAIGADHAGYDLKEFLKNYLITKGIEVIDKGAYSLESVDYPTFAKSVSNSILEKEADLGILVCGTGIGISISANRHKGIRAALCTNSTMAKLTRQHNDANILVLGSRMTGDILAIDILESFLETEFEGGRHLNRINAIEL